MAETDTALSANAGAGVESIVGFPFSTLTLRSSVELLARWAAGEDAVAGRPRWFVCANPHSLEVARRDAAFAAAVRAADLVTADGTGIVLASRLLGGCIPERVCGPDLFPSLCATLDRTRPGTRMFFLGTTEATLATMAAKVEREFPRLIVAGTLAPPFRAAFAPADDAAMVAAVNAARPDVLWVGLGAPKQEKWVHRCARRLETKLVGPVGGVFDFYTGRVKLPPPWAQRLGLIWLFRLCQEPRRLLRRNLDSPVFLARVLAQRIRRATWRFQGGGAK